MQTTSTGWHVASWGFWGWLETGVKGVGILVGLLAGMQALGSSAAVVIGGNPNLAAVILLGLMCLLTVLVVPVLRVMQKEIVALVFAILNALAHLGMFYYLLKVPDSITLPVIFGAAYIVGELVKQRFLAVSGYTENGQTMSQMVNFSRGLAGIYLLLVILVIL